MRFDIVGLESPCVDLNINVENFPAPDGGERVLDSSWQGGGKVATGMIAAARLNARGAFIGSVGDDSYGQFCRRDFEKHGIDTRYLITREKESTLFDVVISDKKSMGRSILFYPGNAPVRFMDVEELPDPYLENTRYLYVSQVNNTTREAMRRAKKAGASVVMDADSYTPGDEEAFGLIDVMIGSAFYYRALFPSSGDEDYERNCRKLREKGPGIVVFTRGPKGCLGLGEEGFFTLPAFPVEVVDTVGAGDVFHGAFIAGLLQGYTVRETARLASAVSAVKCTRIGGRAGIPDWDTVRAFMETGRIDYREIEERVQYYKRGLL
nr:carbohydrate kinase family protein [uncultured Eisenbergiella sp.]